MPKYGFVNFHGEILPDYPGRAERDLADLFRAERNRLHDPQRRQGYRYRRDRLQERRPIRFGATLRETVEGTLAEATDRVPAAFAELLEHWDRYWSERRPNVTTRHFTTPTFWQFLRIARNNRRLFRQARAGKPAT